jgi:hypothetical protein
MQSAGEGTANRTFLSGLPQHVNGRDPAAPPINRKGNGSERHDALASRIDDTCDHIYKGTPSKRVLAKESLENPCSVTQEFDLEENDRV